MTSKKNNLKEFINYQNKSKILFTPGPGSLILENFTSMQPCFGRGDKILKKRQIIKTNTMKKRRKIHLSQVLN